MDKIKEKGEMKMLLVEYPKCSTCKRAKQFLDNNHFTYKERNIKENNPTYEELKEWIQKSKLPIAKWFNTSGILYRELNLKDKLLNMTDDDKIKLLSTNGMLVKRPILITNDNIIIGFNELKWKESLR